MLISLFLLPLPLLAGEFDLHINDVSGLDEPWPLIGGLPFPEGKLHDAGQIRIIDGQGHEVPAQIDVAATWRDGSIRWAQAGLTASPQGDYRVEFGPGISRTAPPRPLRLDEEQDGRLTVDTGAAAYEFLPDRLLPENARMGETVFLADSGDGAYLVDNHNRLSRVAGPRAEIETEIVKNGPVRTVIKREGWYVTDDDDRVARARMWFYLSARSPYLRITHSLVLTEDTNDLWVRDYGLEFRTSESPDEVIFPLGESDEVFSPRGSDVELEPVTIPFTGEEVYMYQDTYPHFMESEYRAAIARASGQSAVDHFYERLRGKNRDVFWTDHWISENDVAGDWGHAWYGGHGMTLLTPYLSQRFPKEIAVGSESMRVSLWSARGGRELDFRPPTLIDEYWQSWSELYGDGVEELAQLSSNAQGMARTHDVWLMPHAAGDGPDSIARRAGAASDPPLVLADPFWLSATDAFDWPFHPRDEANFPEAEAAASDWWDAYVGAYQSHRPAGGGFIDWGKTRTMRGGGNSFWRLFSGTMDYYLRMHVWGAYARSGERSYFNYGSWISQFAADIGHAHWTGGDKFKGGGVRGRSDTPMYWGTGSRLNARPELTSFLNEYFLTGNERLKDVAKMVGQSYIERWDPEDAPNLGRRNDGVFRTITGLTALYTFTWNEAYIEMAGQLADVLIDLDSPNGLSDEIRFGNLYKVDRNFFWLYTYHRATGDESARQAMLKGLDYKYRFSRFRLGGQQCRAGVMYAVAYKMTEDPVYLRVLNYYLNAALERRRLGARVSSGFLGNTFPTINMPGALSVLASVDEPITAFPTAEYYQQPEPSNILFRKPDGAAPTTFQATVWMEDADITPTQVRVMRLLGDGETADPLEAIEVDFEQAFMTSYSGRQDPHVYAMHITVPSDTSPGLYFLDVPRAERVRVLESSAPQIGVYAPQGATIRGDAMPNYFHVGDDIADLQIHLNQPLEVRRPDGSVAVEADSDNIGELRVAVDGHSGVWSVASTRNAVVGLLNVEPIIARSPDWLPTDAGLEPAPRFEPPTQNMAFVPWETGQALHLPGSATLSFDPGDAGDAHDPFTGRRGTIELWFRPNWSSTELSYVRYRDLYFLDAGSHQFEYRRGFLRRSIGELSTVNLRLHGYLGEQRNSLFAQGKGYAGEFFFDAGEWYHLAITWELIDDEGATDGRFALFINGEPVEAHAADERLSRPRVPSAEAQYTLRETNEQIEIGPLDGTIAQLKISDTVRYDAPFEPSMQFDEPDDNTVVRFPFDGDFKGLTGTGSPIMLQWPDN